MLPSSSAFTAIALAAAFGWAVTASAAVAQQAKQAAPANTKQAAPKPAANAAPANSEAALRQRVDQLEEQLIDLQVVIGTLESLAKSPTNPAQPAAGDAQRIQALEAQLKSLSTQIEQLGEKVRGAGEPTKRSEAAPQRPTEAAGPAPASPADAGDPQSTASFGSSTVTSARPDEQPAYETAPGAALPPIGAEPQGQPPAAEQRSAAIAPPSDSGDPKHDYEVAYSYVIQRDYGAAQAGFTDFMKRYPKDALVPNALYWLGETHYQQRNFADAAEAFDLVTKLYASSPKAADSQLKRALSYSALGKNNEACAALTELSTKFQNAPQYVATRAGSERRRLGCSG